MALALPVLVILLTGIIDFGMVQSDQISLRQGVREGARQAVVNDLGSACTGTSTAKLVCLTKSRTDVDDVSVYVKLAPTTGTTPVPSSASVGTSIIVCAAAPMDSLSGFWSAALDDRHLTAETRMRVEVASSITTGGDADPTGGGWAWCS
jgi:hypothetical protein